MKVFVVLEIMSSLEMTGKLLLFSSVPNNKLYWEKFTADSNMLVKIVKK